MIVIYTLDKTNLSRKILTRFTKGFTIKSFIVDK